MTWADRLLRLAVGDPKRQIADQLVAIHRRLVAQAERLAADAAQAPTPGAERELRALAATEDAAATVLGEALHERGSAPTPVAAPVPNGAARNHWARLVACLETCRETRAQLLRHTPRLIELDPSLDGLLASLLRGLDAEVLALRSLIARADPQALD
jgi:hypothetical protein